MLKIRPEQMETIRQFSLASDSSTATVATCCPKPKKEVVLVRALISGTQGVKNPANSRPDDLLASSILKQTRLADNPPSVLVRGCQEVELEAVTNPLDEPVEWQVESTENDYAGSAPTITPLDGGKRARLKTDKVGSYSVIAKLDGSKVVWNVVFVWVKVKPDTSRFVVRTSKFGDAGPGIDPTSKVRFTRFKSGDFIVGKFPWEGQVKVEVLGGGADRQLGINKVKIHYLQNGTKDTLTGKYQGGGIGRDTPVGGLPILDSNEDDGNPFADRAKSMFAIKPNNWGPDREVTFRDAPGGSFLTRHPNTAPPQPLRSISGIIEFIALVASLSDDAPNNIVIHAKTKWSVDFSGVVLPSGKYVPQGQKVTKDARFQLVSEATGGQDAGNAGVETFPPIFRLAAGSTFTPPPPPPP
jgi:hypothetical protein